MSLTPEKPLWQIETERYIPRLSKSLDHLVQATKAFGGLPIPPFERSLTPEEHFAFTLVIFARSGLTVVDQLLDNVGLLWSQGRMIGVSGLVRFSLEYWSAVHFGRKILEAYGRDRDLEEAARKTTRLTFSAKTQVKLPWGGVTENVAYNILTLIDELAREHTTARADYEFLSEASHPNFLQNTYFVMASRLYDNYANETFKAHAHELLERTIAVVEAVSLGVASDASRTLEMGRPLLRLSQP